MDGLHLTADLSGCPAGLAAMSDPQALQGACLQAVRDAGLQPVAELFHRFAAGAAAADGKPPAGITGVVLLAESHLAVHTWPEFGSVTLDVYVCNVGVDNRDRARQLIDALCAVFAPQDVVHNSLQRGRVDLPLAAA
ncbi:S-adenosylmethionine decarboxylase family protein [Piscinibacter sakaiensis]|uniref:S-adenosylmethionine decarboxylase family protein n=1 Tax=Piscinibacter sakaiensis TaxID=1547922 RepID=UPI003AAB4322